MNAGVSCTRRESKGLKNTFVYAIWFCMKVYVFITSTIQGHNIFSIFGTLTLSRGNYYALITISHLALVKKIIKIMGQRVRQFFLLCVQKAQHKWEIIFYPYKIGPNRPIGVSTVDVFVTWSYFDSFLFFCKMSFKYEQMQSLVIFVGLVSVSLIGKISCYIHQINLILEFFWQSII